MSGRHQPEAGADSPDARGPYLVTMDERFDGHPRIKVRIPSAYGPRDAGNQAVDQYPGYSVVKVVADVEVHV